MCTYPPRTRYEFALFVPVYEIILQIEAYSKIKFAPTTRTVETLTTNAKVFFLFSALKFLPRFPHLNSNDTLSFYYFYLKNSWQKLMSIVSNLKRVKKRKKNAKEKKEETGPTFLMNLPLIQRVAFYRFRNMVRPAIERACDCLRLAENVTARYRRKRQYFPFDFISAFPHDTS